MWELIQSNKRKSILIFLLMGLCLLLLGYFIGQTWLGPDGGLFGIIFALVIWAILSAISYFGGSGVLLMLSSAKEVSHDVHPQLYNIVEEMKIAANWPHIPKVYIIADRAPNAFATGVKPDKTAIAVTAGLLSSLNRDELQGVIAHEMSHIVNRDVLFVTFAGVLLGSIVMISEVFLRSMWFSGGSSRRYKAGGKSGSHPAVVIIAIILAILAPIMARLLYFALSRKREYLADASAVRLTRYPEGLASALEKIADSGLTPASANKVTAPMYIINPMKKEGMQLSNLSSTHPPISERINILRNMAGGANYAQYQKALWATQKGRTFVLPASGLHDTTDMPIRKSSVPATMTKPGKHEVRDLGDLMRVVNNYAFLGCVCGLKIKLPPDFKKKELDCPRCGRHIAMPHAELAALAAAAGTGGIGEQKQATKEPGQVQTYIRRVKGWESFRCSCGHMMQLSPIFKASHMKCPACGKTTMIKS
ncbi:MAG: M48 family metallopeptidase [bacterium]